MTSLEQPTIVIRIEDDKVGKTPYGETGMESLHPGETGERQGPSVMFQSMLKTFGETVEGAGVSDVSY